MTLLNRIAQSAHYRMVVRPRARRLAAVPPRPEVRALRELDAVTAGDTLSFLRQLVDFRRRTLSERRRGNCDLTDALAILKVTNLLLAKHSYLRRVVHPLNHPL